MKKAIQIKLKDQLFNIEEAGVSILENYLNSLRKHFISYKDGEEIISDIEFSLSEKLSNLNKQKDSLILKEDITGIISDMGNIDDIDLEEDSLDKSTLFERIKNKVTRFKLFRDIDNRQIAGVCSGLGIYFGIDPVIIRIIWGILVVVFFFISSNISILLLTLYGLLWIAMPEAKTTIQRLEMQGKSINLSAIESETKKDRNPNRTLTAQLASKLQDIASTLFRLIVRLLKLSIRLTGVGIIIGAIISFFAVLTGVILVSNTTYEGFNWPIPNMQNADYFSILVIVSVVLIFSVLLLSINLGVTLAKLKNTFRLIPSIVLIIIAVSAGAYLVATVTNKTYEYVKSVEENPENYEIITKEISAEDLNSLTIRGDYNNKFDVKFVESDSPVIRVIGNKYSIEHLDIDVLHTGSVFINCSFNRFAISLLYNPVTIEIGINKFQTLNLNGIQSLESEVALDIDVITITQFYGTSLDLDVTSDDLIISNHNKLTARLAGEVNKLHLSMYGISEIDALELKSEETILNIYNYKSKITVNSEKISYSGGRFAEVIYKGDPEILNLDQKYQYNNYQDNDSIDLIKLK